LLASRSLNRRAVGNGCSGSGAAVRASSAERPVCLDCRRPVALPRTAAVGHDPTFCVAKDCAPSCPFRI